MNSDIKWPQVGHNVKLWEAGMLPKFYHELLTHLLLHRQCFSRESLILVMGHILKLQKLKTHTQQHKTHYWLFSKPGMLVGAAAMEIYSQIQAEEWEETRWRQLINKDKYSLVIIIGRMENTLVWLW